VAEGFMPSEESVEAVTAWLVASGVLEKKIFRSQSQGWLEFHATAAEAEHLLDTEYFLYKHEFSGQSHIACSEYSLPKHVQDHVDFITPTLHFDARIAASKADILARSERPASFQYTDSSRKRSIGSGIGSALNRWGPKKGKIIGVLKQILGLIKSTLLQEVFPCSSYITPSCLRELYSFPTDPPMNATNSIGIVEYTPQCYYETDLVTFFAAFSPDQQQTTPTLNSIDGGSLCTTSTSFGNQGESNLDLEYYMAIINPGLATLYQVGDFVESASFDNFLDAIHGDYCSFEGGANPGYDPGYPDTSPGG
jgi:tripeptidyl-peptidase-1